jgi:hypothetical protein
MRVLENIDMGGRITLREGGKTGLYLSDSGWDEVTGIY